jgi:hypothetical protein
MNPPLEVEHWMGSGPIAGYQPHSNSECQGERSTSEAAGANLGRQEGNNPERLLRSLTIGLVVKEVVWLRQPGCWLRSSHHFKSA